MRFVDQVRIFVKAGDGGNGAVAFRREKFIEKGGPSGGDGGNGGSVIFVADDQLTTLLDFRYQQHHVARHGQHGMGSDCNGKNSDDLVLKVPVGTLFKDEPTGALLADLDTNGQIFIAAQGGRGGLGNINFATSTRQTPRFAQDGTKGEERTILLELKLLADVGLLGYPNAGKSTFISRISRAKPKVADYPFTTLVPNLGVVQYKDGLSFVMADIPGLIEGAADGVGLGHQFLRHVERCRVLVHLVDLSALSEGRDPVHEYDVLNAELKKYSPELATKPQILVANKLDLPDAQAALAGFSATMKQRGLTVLGTSGVTGEGVGAVLDAVAKVLYAPATSKPKVRAADREAEATAAKTTAAKTPAAKTPAAKTTAAKTTAAKTTAAKTTAAKTTAAKTTAAKTTAAKTSAAKTSAAKTSAAKTSAAKTTAAKTPAEKTAAAKTSTAKTSAAKTSAAKTSAAKTSAAKTSGAKTSGAKTSAAKTSAAKTSGAKTSRAKTSAPKTSGAKTSAPKTAAPRSTGKRGARR